MNQECYFCYKKCTEESLLYTVYEPLYVKADGEASQMEQWCCKGCIVRWKPDILGTLKQSNDFFWKQMESLKAMDAAGHALGLTSSQRRESIKEKDKVS